MTEAVTVAADAAQQADAEFDRAVRAAMKRAFALPDLAARLGVSFADAVARLDWLERDEAARSGDSDVVVTERLLALPRRELALALAKPSELGRVLFAPEPFVPSSADVSPEMTLADDAAASSDDASPPAAAVPSDADSGEPAPNDAGDANDAVAGTTSQEPASTPRAKKKR